MTNPSNEQFTVKPAMVAIAIAYNNPTYTLIGDQALPRVPVGGEKFSYQHYDEGEMYTVPDTRIGRRSAPNRVELEGTEETARCVDFGIDVPLDNPTIEEAEASGWDPRGRAVARATSIVQLGREVRVANIVSNPDNYHTEHKAVLAGSDQFSHADSDPVKLIDAYLESCWIRPNQIIFGQSIWSVLKFHPKVIKAINRNAGDTGVARLEDLAQLLELRRVLVGASRVNINKPGKNAVLHRAWGNMVSGQFIDETADSNGGITWGFTAVHGEKVAGTKEVDMGLRGGELIRSGETVKELVIAQRAGFLLQDVI